MTDPSVQLKTFVQRVLRLASPSTDIGGSVIPSLSGTVNAGSDTIRSLHHAVMEFANAYSSRHTSSQAEAAMRLSAKDVEASLMVAVTVGVLSSRDGDALISELHSLIETA